MTETIQTKSLQTKILLASPDTAVLRTVEPILRALGAESCVAMDAHTALEQISAAKKPTLVILDTSLPGMEPGQLLAAARSESTAKDFSIVLISDIVTQEYVDRIAEGIVEDLILREAPLGYWQLRIEQALRAGQIDRELDSLRETAVSSAQIDRLTGIYNRDAMLSVFFRETDRVQRMNSPLCIVLFDIDDFGHWNERLGTEACDQLLRMVVERTTRLLRSYDVIGRSGKDEFLLLMPGCTADNAVLLADRMRMDAFSAPYRVDGESIRLSACFGVAISMGRSPVVVLREAEQALQWAKEAGPESIEYFGDARRPAREPVTYLSPSSGDELLAW